MFFFSWLSLAPRDGFAQRRSRAVGCWVLGAAPRVSAPPWGKHHRPVGTVWLHRGGLSTEGHPQCLLLLPTESDSSYTVSCGTPVLRQGSQQRAANSSQQCLGKGAPSSHPPPLKTPPVLSPPCPPAGSAPAFSFRGCRCANQAESFLQDQGRQVPPAPAGQGQAGRGGENRGAR